MKLLTYANAILVLMIQMCNKTAVDPYSTSLFYFVNNSNYQVLLNASAFNGNDSIVTDQITVAIGDTAYLGTSSSMGAPSPDIVFSQIIVQKADSSHIIYERDTLKFVMDNGWDHIKNSNGTVNKWFFKYY